MSERLHKGLGHTGPGVRGLARGRALGSDGKTAPIPMMNGMLERSHCEGVRRRTARSFSGTFGRVPDSRTLRSPHSSVRRGTTAGGYVPPFSVALIHIGVAEWDDAFASMIRAIDERDPIIMPIKAPGSRQVRPRYRALPRTMKLAA